MISSLSQNPKKVLERFVMHDCSYGVITTFKREKFNKGQSPQNDIEQSEMKDIPYASVVGSLRYSQTCTRPDISFIVGMFGRYQAIPMSSLDYYKESFEISAMNKRLYAHIQALR